jgi:hypothetical protein
MSESEIEKAVCDYARKRGCYVRKFSTPSHRGVPDQLFITPSKEYYVAEEHRCNTLGQVFFIEFKAPGCKPTALQRRELALLNDHHGRIAFWCDSVEKGKEIVRGMLE